MVIKKKNIVQIHPMIQQATVICIKIFKLKLFSAFVIKLVCLNVVCLKHGKFPAAELLVNTDEQLKATKSGAAVCLITCK